MRKRIFYSSKYLLTRINSKNLFNSQLRKISRFEYSQHFTKSEIDSKSAILGIKLSQSTTQKEIKKQYFKKIKEKHPDSNSGNFAFTWKSN